MFPGQFPGNALYNLDYFEQQEWTRQALIKQTEWELDILQLTRLAQHGQKEYSEKQDDLISRLKKLDPPTPEQLRKQKEAADKKHIVSWNFIKTHGRRKNGV